MKYVDYSLNIATSIIGTPMEHKRVKPLCVKAPFDCFGIYSQIAPLQNFNIRICLPFVMRLSEGDYAAER
jgi:hypothetical protein